MQKPQKIWIVMAVQEEYTAQPIRAFNAKCEAVRYMKMLANCDKLEGVYDTIWIEEVMLH